MATYIELQRQAEKLMAEAEQLRAKELAQVISDIRATMEVYGITPEDLGAKRRGRPPSKKQPSGRPPKAKAKVAYRGPGGETWSGRGRRPQWIAKLLKGGKKLEDFAA